VFRVRKKVHWLDLLKLPDDIGPVIAETPGKRISILDLKNWYFGSARRRPDGCRNHDDRLQQGVRGYLQAA